MQRGLEIPIQVPFEMDLIERNKAILENYKQSSFQITRNRDRWPFR